LVDTALESFTTTELNEKTYNELDTTISCLIQAFLSSWPDDDIISGIDPYVEAKQAIAPIIGLQQKVRTMFLRTKLELKILQTTMT